MATEQETLQKRCEKVWANKTIETVSQFWEHYSRTVKISQNGISSINGISEFLTLFLASYYLMSSSTVIFGGNKVEVFGLKFLDFNVLHYITILWPYLHTYFLFRLRKITVESAQMMFRASVTYKSLNHTDWSVYQGIQSAQKNILQIVLNKNLFTSALYFLPGEILFQMLSYKTYNQKLHPGSERTLGTTRGNLRWIHPIKVAKIKLTKCQNKLTAVVENFHRYSLREFGAGKYVWQLWSASSVSLSICCSCCERCFVDVDGLPL